MKANTLYTIGHSTHKLTEFLGLLEHHQINCLVDIRTIPKSRRVPWSNQDKLRDTLKEHGIIYKHIAKLGGMRHARKDSKNTGWHKASFRGYADHMETDEFLAGLNELNDLLPKHRIAVMCAEAVPWRCHRSLIADAELAQGIEVKHIINLTSTPKAHVMTSFARVLQEQPPKILYSDEQLDLPIN